MAEGEPALTTHCSLFAVYSLSAVSRVELLEGGAAGAQVALVEPIERRAHGAQMGMQIFRIRIKVQYAGYDFTGDLALLQKIHRGDTVVDVVFGGELAQFQHRSVVLRDFLAFAWRIVRRDRLPPQHYVVLSCRFASLSYLCAG